MRWSPRTICEASSESPPPAELRSRLVDGRESSPRGRDVRRAGAGRDRLDERLAPVLEHERQAVRPERERPHLLCAEDALRLSQDCAPQRIVAVARQPLPHERDQVAEIHEHPREPGRAFLVADGPERMPLRLQHAHLEHRGEEREPRPLRFVKYRARRLAGDRHRRELHGSVLDPGREDERRARSHPPPEHLGDLLPRVLDRREQGAQRLAAAIAIEC
jgi:hypothetical protein